MLVSGSVGGGHLRRLLAVAHPPDCLLQPPFPPPAPSLPLHTRCRHTHRDEPAGAPSAASQAPPAAQPAPEEPPLCRSHMQLGKRPGLLRRQARH